MRIAVRLAVLAAFGLVIAGGVFAGVYAGRRQVARSDDSAAVPSPTLRPAPTTEQLIADLQARIARSPASAQTYTSLGTAYLQKVRESGDPAYYGKAEAVLAKAAELDPSNADTFVALGTLALARHQFEAALQHGLRARELNPYKSAALGVIGDAQVELGRYDEAQTSVQAMVDLRPDLASYARASYIRELYGDVPGAIEAMQRAVNAGAPGSENTAWTRVQLGHLYFNSGDLTAAETEYEHTLFELPNYAHARAGLARVKAAQGDYAGAITIYEDLAAGVPMPEYVIALAEVYHAAGNVEADARTEGLVKILDRLYRDNGVNTDAEMALFAADRGLDLPGAVERARRALAVRPSIYTHDVLAWSLYQEGRYDEAMAAAEEALRLGTRDSLMRYHAGMIAAALGQTDRARALLREAVTQNPHFSLRYGAEATVTLRRLDTPPRTIAGR